MTGVLGVYSSPYPDEDMYTWILRIAEMNNASIHMFGKYFLHTRNGKLTADFNRAWRSYPSYSSGLGAYWIQKNWGHDLSAHELLTRHSLVMMNAMFQYTSNQAGNIHGFLYNYRPGELDIRMTGYIRTVCFCPKCLEQDVENGRFPYYRVWHQMANVCALHGIQLVTFKPDTSGFRHVFLDRLDMKELYSKEGSLDPDREKAIAWFLYEVYKDPPMISFQQLHAVLKRKRTENPLLIPEMQKIYEESGWMPKGQVVQIEKIERLTYGIDILISWILFLFRNYKSFKDYIIEDEAAYLRQLFFLGKDIVNAQYDICGSDGILPYLRCRKCGTRFWIHPYALQQMRGCPECELEKDSQQLVSAALENKGGYIPIQGSTTGTSLYTQKIIHRKCGRICIHTASEVLWGNARCTCDRNITIEKLQEELFPAGEYIINSVREKRVVNITHKACGTTFEIYRDKRHIPQCPKCRYSEQFAANVRRVTGDEYAIEMDNGRTSLSVTLRHNTCGLLLHLKSGEQFLSGTRCPVCTPVFRRDEILGFIRECCDMSECSELYTDEMSRVHIRNGRTGEESQLSFSKVMQDLTSYDLVKWLPIRRIRRMEVPLSKNIHFLKAVRKETERGSDLDAKEYCAENGIVWDVFRKAVKRFEKKGYIENIGNCRYRVCSEFYGCFEE